VQDRFAQGDCLPQSAKERKTDSKPKDEGVKEAVKRTQKETPGRFAPWRFAAYYTSQTVTANPPAKK